MSSSQPALRGSPSPRVTRAITQQSLSPSPYEEDDETTRRSSRRILDLISSREEDDDEDDEDFVPPAAKTIPVSRSRDVAVPSTRRITHSSRHLLEGAKDHTSAKTTNVGAERYQAVVPDTVMTRQQYIDEADRNPNPHEESERLIWCPSRTLKSSVSAYLRDSKSETHNQSSFDEEQALYLLHRCGYSIPKAKLHVSPGASFQNEAKEYYMMARSPSGFDKVGTPKTRADSRKKMLCFQCHRIDEKDIVCVKCNVAYHRDCVGAVHGDISSWVCSRHACAVCDDSNTVLKCACCPMSYCTSHVPEDILQRDGIQLCTMCDARARIAHGFEEPPSQEIQYEFREKLLAFSRSRNIYEEQEIQRIFKEKVDLYKLYRLVTRLGGHRRVSESNSWLLVAVLLGYKSNLLSFKRVISVYHQHLREYEEDSLTVKGQPLPVISATPEALGLGAGSKIQAVISEELADRFKIRWEVGGVVRYGEIFKNISVASKRKLSDM